MKNQTEYEIFGVSFFERIIQLKVHKKTDKNYLAGKNGMVGWSVQNFRSAGDINCNYCFSNVSYLLIRKGYGSHLAKAKIIIQYNTLSIERLKCKCFRFITSGNML